MCKLGKTLLPTRVIDVGNAGDERLRLCETKKKSTGQYAALSYCWGSGQSLTTTSANVQDMKSGLLLPQLPQTLIDAVHVTRSLRIQYLWVDALCIIQDSVEDWEKQSEQMSTIYEKAYLVIVASSAASATQGFLNHKRQKRTYHLPLPDVYGTQATIAVRTNPQSGLHSSRSKEDPLAKRAWAFQEQQMSTRCLVFSKDELQWICKTDAACECGFPAKGGLHHPLLQTCCDDSHKRDVPSAELTSQAGKVWRAVVQDYSNRGMTRADDKLPAISGVASRFAARMGLHYVAGLWEEDIIEGLTWSDFGVCSIPTDYQAPSFSWASVQGAVRYGPEEDWVSCSSMSDVGSVVPGRNRFGKVSDAWITLKAPILRGHLEHVLYRRGTFRSDDPKIEIPVKFDSHVVEFDYTAQDNKTGRSVRRCNLPQPPGGLGRERSEEADDHPHAVEPGSTRHTSYLNFGEASVWLLHLGGWRPGKRQDQERHGNDEFYLLLGKSPRDPQKYERIGHGQDYGGQLLAGRYSRFTSQTITIL